MSSQGAAKGREFGPALARRSGSAAPHALAATRWLFGVGSPGQVVIDDPLAHNASPHRSAHNESAHVIRKCGSRGAHAKPRAAPPMSSLVGLTHNSRVPTFASVARTRVANAPPWSWHQRPPLRRAPSRVPTWRPRAAHRSCVAQMTSACHWGDAAGGTSGRRAPIYISGRLAGTTGAPLWRHGTARV